MKVIYRHSKKKYNNNNNNNNNNYYYFNTVMFHWNNSILTAITWVVHQDVGQCSTSFSPC